MCVDEQKPNPFHEYYRGNFNGAETDLLVVDEELVQLRLKFIANVILSDYRNVARAEDIPEFARVKVTES